MPQLLPAAPPGRVGLVQPFDDEALDTAGGERLVPGGGQFRVGRHRDGLEGRPEGQEQVDEQGPAPFVRAAAHVQPGQFQYVEGGVRGGQALREHGGPGGGGRRAPLHQGEVGPAPVPDHHLAVEDRPGGQLQCGHREIGERAGHDAPGAGLERHVGRRAHDDEPVPVELRLVRQSCRARQGAYGGGQRDADHGRALGSGRPCAGSASGAKRSPSRSSRGPMSSARKTRSAGVRQASTSVQDTGADTVGRARARRV